MTGGWYWYVSNDPTVLDGPYASRAEAVSQAAHSLDLAHFQRRALSSLGRVPLEPLLGGDAFVVVSEGPPDGPPDGLPGGPPVGPPDGAISDPTRGTGA